MNIKQLRELAEAAIDEQGRVMDLTGMYVTFKQSMSPKTILALLDLIQLQHEVIDEYQTFSYENQGHNDRACCSSEWCEVHTDDCNASKAQITYDAFNKEK